MKIEIRFTSKKDGSEDFDFEFVSDLWCSAREQRPNMPRYNDIEITEIVINGKVFSREDLPK